MTDFVLALGAFVAAHVIPTRREFRARLVSLLGERGYLIAYSALSILLMIWVIRAAQRAPYFELWPLAAWMQWGTLLVMPFALILFVTGALSPNPLSVAFRRESFRAESPGIVAITRHPILWGFALWSAVHLLANGDLISVILFSGLTLFAIAGMSRVDRKKRASLGESQWKTLTGPTSCMPFAAILAGRARFPMDRRTILAAMLALVMYAALLFHGHLALFGADPLMGIR